MLHTRTWGKKNLRNESQRRRRDQSREEAREKAAAHGDATHWKLYDKTTSYARMAASKCRLEENYQFLPMDALLPSDDMGGLFCFYLHFFLGVTIPEDLDQQPHGVFWLTVYGLHISAMTGKRLALCVTSILYVSTADR
jgi:hypothetical protein